MLLPTLFLSLFQWSALPAENLVWGLQSSLFMLSAHSTKFSKCVTSQAGIMSSPIHHPDVRLPVSPVSSLNRIMHGQGVLFNRATVPTAISTETFNKFNLKNTGQVCTLQRSKLVLPNTKQWTFWFTSAESLSTYYLYPPSPPHFIFFLPFALWSLCIFIFTASAFNGRMPCFHRWPVEVLPSPLFL